MQAMWSVRKTQGVQRGFTLIELMIVLAIVGVLAMVAVPQYRDYLVRTKVAEGLNLVTPAKMAVSETINARGNTTFNQAATGYQFVTSTDIKTVTNITIADTGGIITITYGDIGGNGNGTTLRLVPTANASAITWVCQVAPTPGATLPAQYAPESCRS